MSSESALWGLTREKLSPFGLLHRLENRVGLGTPDVLYCIRRLPRRPAVTGLLELKETDWPVLPFTPLVVPSLTDDQCRFLDAWERAGGRAFILMQVARDYFLCRPDAAWALLNRELTRSSVTERATLAWRTPWPMAAILTILAGT